MYNHNNLSRSDEIHEKPTKKTKAVKGKFQLVDKNSIPNKDTSLTSHSR